ncbi:ATP-binding protein [Planctomicrobium sp. SH668]|uniref:Dph6-related ATP pyrophosphatase n=1 Tax=Planctomicrobium sp. SH668 TaxID=3448126 RepID=UPI003F5B6C2B
MSVTISANRSKRVAVSWSSGKDCAWVLHLLRQDPDVDVVALCTTFNEEFDRVGMHAVRSELVELQAERVALPLHRVNLPWPCSNENYERKFGELLEVLAAKGATHLAFGDLFLEDIRDYRIRLLSGSGITPISPAWVGRAGTALLARQMIDSGFESVLTCVDPRVLDESFLGRRFDSSLLRDLPGNVDPCGENGEFHTFCTHGPIFSSPLDVSTGERVDREGFCFIDLTKSK